MRSGVIAQKLGMTRIFTDAGEHIPVTVLRLDRCQVVGHRTSEKNGYTALQLGAGTPKVKRLSRAARGHFAVANVEPKRKLVEFRVSPENVIEVGAEITADHFVEGQFVDVSGTTIGKGFAGAMKRHNFGGLRAFSRRVGEPSQPRLDRPAPGPRQGVQGQEDGGPYGRRERHHAEFARGEDRPRARPDHDPRRGAWRQGRLGAVARCGEAEPCRMRRRSQAPSAKGPARQRTGRRSRRRKQSQHRPRRGAKSNAGRRHHARRQEGGNG